MALLTTNGMSIDDLTAAPNGPGLVQQLGNQVDQFYGSSVANAAALPASGKFLGQMMFVTDVRELATWDGIIWQGVTRTYNPAVTGATATGAARYSIRDRWIKVEFDISFTGSLTANPTLSLPSGVTFASTTARVIGGAILVDTSAPATRIATVSPSNTTAVSMSYEQSNARVGLTAAGPWTWASGDSINGSFQARIDV